MVGRGCLFCPQRVTAPAERSRQWLTTAAHQGSFPFQRVSFFLLSSTAAAHGVSNIILAAWLLHTEKAIPKHKTCNNFRNILPAADTMESASQNSRTAEAEQKPWSQDCHVIWHLLAPPSMPFQVSAGKAKTFYLLIKVSHNSSAEQAKEIPT